MTRDEQPRMFGLSVFCAVLGAAMAAGVIKGVEAGDRLPTATILLPFLLFLGAYLAFRLDAQLSAMTPEERDAWWNDWARRHKPIDRDPPDAG